MVVYNPAIKCEGRHFQLIIIWINLILLDCIDKNHKTDIINSHALQKTDKCLKSASDIIYAKIPLFRQNTELICAFFRR